MTYSRIGSDKNYPRQGKLHADVDTGEMVRLTPLAEEVYHRYLYVGGHATVGLVNATRIAKTKMPSVAHQLLWMMIGQVAPASGYVHVSNKVFSKELGVCPARVGRLVTILKKYKLVCKVGPKQIMLNPLVVFRGAAHQHEAAIAEWQRLHPIGMVPRKSPESSNAA